MTDNFSNDENALFRAKIREADLAASHELQEIQGAADELARQAIIDKLKQAEAEREKLKLEFEQEASGRVDDILSYVELRTEGDEGYFADNEMVLESFWQLFKPLFDYFKVDADFEAYRVKKEKEEGWLAAIIKFLRDIRNALKELIKKVFSADLSWDQSLNKEIKELEAKLNGGNLSEEEFARIYERLESLQLVKLRLQICLAGCIVVILARLFSAELTASVETTKEEGKEKASAKEKEATKEVHEIEIKLDAEGRYQIVVPSYLLDFSSGVARPITLTKPELDLLPKPLKNLMHPIHKDDMNKGNSVVPKQEVKEKQGQENKKATQPAPKPVAAPKEPGKVPGADGVKFCFKSYGGSINFNTRRSNANVNSVNGKKPESNNKQENKFAGSERRLLNNDVNSVNKEGGKSTNGQKADSPYAKLAAKAAERNARKKCAEAPTKHDYPIDHFQVPAETNGKSHASDRNEPQQSSMNNAQENPKSKFTDVVKERVGQSEGRASRGR